MDSTVMIAIIVYSLNILLSPLVNGGRPVECKHRPASSQLLFHSFAGLSPDALEGEFSSHGVGLRPCIIRPVDKKTSSESPEFSLADPLGSALRILRAIFFAPRSFYLNFSAEGPVKEPAIFALLVGAVAGVFSTLLVTFTEIPGAEMGFAGGLLRNAAFALLSPAAVAVGAGLYLLILKTFVGEVADFRQMYRMFAYASGAMVFSWIPFLGAFFFAYAALVLMAIGIRSVYRATFLTALITALVGFVPLALAYTWITAASAGLVAG